MPNEICKLTQLEVITLVNELKKHDIRELGTQLNLHGGKGTKYIDSEITKIEMLEHEDEYDDFVKSIEKEIEDGKFKQ